jgi:hypothetical protein
MAPRATDFFDARPEPNNKKAAKEKRRLATMGMVVEAGSPAVTNWSATNPERNRG